MARRHLPKALALAAAFLTLPAAATADTFSSSPDAPLIEIATPVDGAEYPQGAYLQAGFGCWSFVSAVVSCEGSVPLGATVDTTTAGAHTFTVTALDYDGRSTTASVTYTVRDLTPPTVSFRTPADGAVYELGAQLTVDYACDDNAGGVGVIFCQGSLPVTAPLDTSRAGWFTFHVDTVDAAGNYAGATVKYQVVDSTPPTATIRTPAEGTSYLLRSSVPADYSCADTPPGYVGSCVGTVPVGWAVDTGSVGAKVFSVRARDGGGNTASATSSYRVVYDFDGFFAPVAPTVTEVKAGDGVPVKFSLNGDQGLDFFAGGAPGWRPAPCNGPSTAQDTATALGRLTYHAANDRYVFFWSTDPAWAGTCKELVVPFVDGTVHTARFAFTT